MSARPPISKSLVWFLFAAHLLLIVSPRGLFRRVKVLLLRLTIFLFIDYILSKLQNQGESEKLLRFQLQASLHVDLLNAAYINEEIKFYRPAKQISDFSFQFTTFLKKKLKTKGSSSRTWRKTVDFFSSHFQKRRLILGSWLTLSFDFAAAYNFLQPQNNTRPMSGAHIEPRLWPSSCWKLTNCFIQLFCGLVAFIASVKLVPDWQGNN